MKSKLCQVCGYSACVEKHHPGGKELHMLVLGTDESYIWDEDLYDKLVASGNIVRLRKKHVRPDDYVMLCPNCHVLVHRYGHQLTEIKPLGDRVEYVLNFINQIETLINYIMRKRARYGITGKELSVILELGESVKLFRELRRCPLCIAPIPLPITYDNRETTTKSTNTSDDIPPNYTLIKAETIKESETMADKSTLTLEKSTVELVGKVKRKLAFDGDRDFTNDEVIVKLCEDYLAKGDDSDEPDVVAVPMEEPAE